MTHIKIKEYISEEVDIIMESISDIYEAHRKDIFKEIQKMVTEINKKVPHPVLGGEATFIQIIQTLINAILDNNPYASKEGIVKRILKEDNRKYK